MAFSVGVRVEEPVALLTQLLDTCGALSMHGGETTDGAGLLFGVGYFVPLVIGSGRVAVEEVITCIAERFIVTRRAKQRHSATTQIAITGCRSAC